MGKVLRKKKGSYPEYRGYPGSQRFYVEPFGSAAWRSIPDLPLVPNGQNDRRSLIGIIAVNGHVSAITKVYQPFPVLGVHVVNGPTDAGLP